jgi:solute carrier family 35 protein
VFQTLTSLAVAYGDFKLLKSGLPNSKVMLSLCIIVLGAVLYIFADSTFKVEAYFWVMLYFVAKVTDMLYTSMIWLPKTFIFLSMHIPSYLLSFLFIEHIVDTVPMTSWGRSFYNNYLSLIPVFFMILISREHIKIQELYESGEIGTNYLFIHMCVVWFIEESFAYFDVY